MNKLKTIFFFLRDWCVGAVEIGSDHVFFFKFYFTFFMAFYRLVFAERGGTSDFLCTYYCYDY